MKLSETFFLTKFFIALEERGIQYAVLRNAESLPASLNGSDIDMLVSNNDIAKVYRIISDVALQYGGCIMGHMRAPHFQQIEILGKFADGWCGCCIDLFSGVYVKSVLPIVDESLLSLRVDNGKGVWTLPHDIGCYLGYVKELLVGRKKSERYLDGAKRVVDSNKDNILCSKKCRQFLRNVLSGGKTSAKIFTWLWMIEMAFYRPFFCIKNHICFIVSKISRFVFPCGKMIVVMGTDGSGKTTILNEILPVIKSMNHQSTVVRHLKPDLLPPLGRFRGVKDRSGHVCTQPHASNPSGFIGSFVRLAYLVCDYVLGYWLKVRFKIARTPIAYWIFDRYAYDMLIDPRRFRIKLPQWLIKIFVFFVPTPDLIICLGGDPEKIYARKPETSLDEVHRQVSALKEFCSRNQNAVWIDTTSSIEKSANEVLCMILKRLSRKGRFS